MPSFPLGEIHFVKNETVKNIAEIKELQKQINEKDIEISGLHEDIKRNKYKISSLNSKMVTEALAELNFVNIKNGSYTGNNTVNRAIPHGLGRTPSFIFIQRAADAAFFHMSAGSSYIKFLTSTSQNQRSVTTMDNTNFYVGNSAQYGESANFDAEEYLWVVVG